MDRLAEISGDRQLVEDLWGVIVRQRADGEHKAYRQGFIDGVRLCSRSDIS